MKGPAVRQDILGYGEEREKGGQPRCGVVYGGTGSCGPCLVPWP